MDSVERVLGEPAEGWTEYKAKRFRQELAAVVNRYSREALSQTPDFLLADYLVGALEAYERAVQGRGHSFVWIPELRQPYVQAMLKVAGETLKARDEWHGPEAEH